MLITPEGHKHYDQRMAVDPQGTIYVSYMDSVPDERGRSRSRLRLARSRDGGRTFSLTTVTTTRVSDKPELAVSSDGQHLYIVYTSSPGPAFVASHDGGNTWTEPAPIVQEFDSTGHQSRRPIGDKRFAGLTSNRLTNG